MTGKCRRTALVWAIAFAVAWTLIVLGAFAHGPCTCITPAKGHPGDTLRVQITAIRGVFNPTKSELGYTPLNLRPKHRSGQPTRTLFRNKRPRRHAFRLPKAAPGEYLVAIWDGSEGGAHFTWQAVRILPTHQRAAIPLQRHDGRLMPTAWIMGVGGTFLTLVIVTAAALRHRKRSPHGSLH